MATGTLGPGLGLRSDPHVGRVAWLSAGSDSTPPRAAALSANGFLFAKPQAEEGVWELGDM